jgi:hypothetical protein
LLSANGFYELVGERSGLCFANGRDSFFANKHGLFSFWDNETLPKFREFLYEERCEV